MNITTRATQKKEDMYTTDVQFCHVDEYINRVRRNVANQARQEDAIRRKYMIEIIYIMCAIIGVFLTMNYLF